MKPKNGSLYVIAHRGVHNSIPENSLPAYEEAIRIGCDYVEIDVRTTSDNRLVSIHNSSTDEYIKGKGAKVKSLTFSELRKLDIGIHSGEKWKNTRIPELPEILKLCKGRIGIYLDLKDAEVKGITDLIKQYEMCSDVIWYIPSDEMNLLEAVINTCPDCLPAPDVGSADNIIPVLDRIPAKIILTDMDHLTERFVSLAHSRNVLVFADDREGTIEEWKRIEALHADGIQTDHPEKLIKYLRKKILNN
jgi:glycerophosphoryl diester phosphodiesterase